MLPARRLRPPLLPSKRRPTGRAEAFGVMSRDDVAQVERAVALLAAGEVVGLPTETVYGLGADAASEAAVRRVFAIKGRPPGHPVILHVGDPADVHELAEQVSDDALRLMRAFRPGPLTLGSARTHRVLGFAGGALPTVVFAMP